MTLQELLSQPGGGPVTCTIFGEGGLGKTTLGATFPRPVFIRTEDGTASLQGMDNVSMLGPVCTKSDGVLKLVEILRTEEHDFKSVILDSTTKLDAIITSEIVASDPKKPRSINQALGGYGAGISAVAEKHREIKAAFDRLQAERNMNVVFLGHADTETLELPDMDPYQRYTVRMHKKSLTHYTDDVDLCGYLRLKAHTFGDGDRKKVTSTGERVLVCYPVASSVSKNRYGIDKDITVTMGENPLVEYIPQLQLKAGE